MNKVKNFRKLSITQERKKALALVRAGLSAIETKKAVENFLDNFNPGFSKRIFFAGVGKNSFEAAQVFERKLKGKIEAGIAIGLGKENLKKIKAFKATHPYPSVANFNATREIIKLFRKVGKDDLVITIISGGGSTMLFQPVGLTLNQETDLIKNLFKKGADIKEINTIRKHVSVARGGFLAFHAYPARMISLIFSDVPGNDPQFIASGPTVLDKTTINDAKRILRKYNLKLKEGLIETPKDKKYFSRVKNKILISNKNALWAMKKEALKLGLKPKIVTEKLRGEARTAGQKILKEIRKSKKNSVFLYGGETTVTIKGKGKGGRNQELALSTLSKIGNEELIISFASDGRDNTGFAGAISDIITKKKAEKFNINPQKFLEDNDSYNFFKKTGDYIETGITGSNVSDLVVAMKT